MTKRTGWFAIQAPQMLDDAGEKSAVRIDIYGEIGWEVTGSEFLRELRALGDDVGEINLRIHSPGGSVLDGWAVANGLASHPARVTARIEGMAASMASVIALAADHVEMPENAYLMIHNVSGGAWGDAEEMRSAIELMEKLQNDIAGFYARRTGLDVDQITAMMAAETWMNGTEAVALGFADEVLAPVALAAVAEGVNMARFDRVPEALAEEPAAEDVEDEAAAEPVADATPAEEPPAEQREEEPPADEPAAEENEEDEEEAPDDAPGGILRNLVAALKRRATGDATSRADQIAAARAEQTQLRAEVTNLTRRAELAEEALAVATATIERHQRDERDLAAVLAETGFSAAESADLPMPVADAKTPEETIRETYKAMDPGPKRAAYRAKHKDILGA